MVKRQFWTIAVSMSVFVLAGCFQNVALDTKTPRMTKEELKSLLGNPEVIVFDVRIGDEWKKSDKKIKGAVREDPEKDFKVWALNYPKDKMIIFY
jgi:hypothetical protein